MTRYSIDSKTVLEVKSFSMLPKLDKGQSWTYSEILGAWVQGPSPHDEFSDPNHPYYNNKLFGYDETEFLKKQYYKG